MERGGGVQSTALWSERAAVSADPGEAFVAALWDKHGGRHLARGDSRPCHRVRQYHRAIAQPQHLRKCPRALTGFR